MLYGNPSAHGTGIEFWGDNNDLTCLYSTVSKLSYFEQKDIQNHGRNSHLLTILSYEIRHTIQGDRLTNTAIDNGINKTTYYGFRFDWITLLFSISALRYNAGLKPSDDLDQCNLMLLEYWTRKALYMYDAQGAKQIEIFINARIDVSNKHVYQIHQYVLNEYLSQKPSKRRFRSIPNLLVNIGLNSKELRALIKTIENDARLFNCSFNDLDCDDVEIIW